MTMRQKVSGGTPSPITPPTDAEGRTHTPAFDLTQFRRLGREMNGSHWPKMHPGGEEFDQERMRVQPGLPPG